MESFLALSLVGSLLQSSSWERTLILQWRGRVHRFNIGDLCRLLLPQRPRRDVGGRGVARHQHRWCNTTTVDVMLCGNINKPTNVLLIGHEEYFCLCECGDVKVFVAPAASIDVIWHLIAGAEVLKKRGPVTLEESELSRLFISARRWGLKANCRYQHNTTTSPAELSAL